MEGISHMNEELLTALCAGLGLTALIEISPIKINPWSWIWKMLKKMWVGFCKSLTAPVLAELATVKAETQETQKALELHIKLAARREADGLRADILRMNNEIMRGIQHTEEEFVEILAKKDRYERYCQENKDYVNSRAVHAIANIERVYDACLEENDFL
jgi:hypothetical protein